MRGFKPRIPWGCPVFTPLSNLVGVLTPPSPLPPMSRPGPGSLAPKLPAFVGSLVGTTAPHTSAFASAPAQGPPHLHSVTREVLLKGNRVSPCCVPAGTEVAGFLTLAQGALCTLGSRCCAHEKGQSRLAPRSVPVFILELAKFPYMADVVQQISLIQEDRLSPRKIREGLQPRKGWGRQERPGFHLLKSHSLGWSVPAATGD